MFPASEMSLCEVEVEFDYEAELEDELSLVPGERLVDVSRQDGGWWTGTQTRTGKRGLFPDNFVKVRNVSFHFGVEFHPIIHFLRENETWKAQNQRLSRAKFPRKSAKSA